MRKEVWEDARLEYITSECSQKDIVEKYGVSATAVANRCKKENWVREREKFKRKINAEVTRKLAQKKARKLLHLSGAVDNLTKIAKKKSGAILQAAQKAEKEGDKTAWLLVNAQEIMQLAKTTETLTDTLYKLTDTQDDNTVVVRFESGEDFAV